MNLKRLLISGIVLAVFFAIYGWLTHGWLLQWIFAVEPTAIWRDMQQAGFGYWASVHLGNVLIGIIYTYTYSRLGIAIQGGKLKRGVVFGVLLWLVAVVPCMFFFSVMMNVSVLIAFTLALALLFKLIIAFLIIAKLYPLPEQEDELSISRRL